MQAGPLKAAPALSFLGLAVMDELCARHIIACTALREKTMKMNVTDTVKQACGHWPRILPALGMKVIKNRHQACPVCGGADRSALTIKRRGTWFCNQCGAGDGLKLVEKVFGISASEAAGKVNADRQPAAGGPGGDGSRRSRNEADRKARPRWPSDCWRKPARPPATPT
jgi:hypothetical protein